MSIRGPAKLQLLEFMWLAAGLACSARMSKKGTLELEPAKGAG